MTSPPPPPRPNTARAASGPVLARPVGVPLYVLAVLAAALLLTMVRGTLMARDRHSRLQPARVPAEVELDPTASRDVTLAAGARFLVVRVPRAVGRRLALHQVLPQRTLVRWVEPVAQDGGLVVLPLEGLQDGTYSVSLAAEGEHAAPVEMDAAPLEREVLGRFVLTRR
jgi:hypothetical protein